MSIQFKAVQREFRELLPDLRRYSIELTSDEEIAEDLVQASIEELCESASSWIAPCGLRKALMFNIRRKWKAEVKRRAELTKAHLVKRMDHRVPIDGCQIAESNLMASKARVCFGKLPETQRQAMLLVIVAGKSYADASADLQIPIGTLMSRLNRGREAMRMLMDNVSCTF